MSTSRTLHGAPTRAPAPERPPEPSIEKAATRASSEPIRRDIRALFRGSSPAPRPARGATP